MASTRELEGPWLPEGGRLVHIGPSKTGTTSLQGAMWAARGEMRRQGVRYLGRSRHSGRAARAVAGRRSPYSNTGAHPPMSRWNAIVRELGRATEPRAIFSSEFLATATGDRIERIVRDLGGDRVHVVVTLRPLPRMLASRWQQGIQAGGVRAFEAWLEELLGRGSEPPDHRIWTAHRHDRLIQHWADVVGADRLTAIVVDERDHTFLLRAFEALLGLEVDTLHLLDDYQNRSLRRAEVEAIRALNLRLRQLGVRQRAQRVLVHDGAARSMKLREPGPDEAAIALPRWVAERAADIAGQVVDGILASGVRVVGDLDSLTRLPSAITGEDESDPTEVPASAAVEMALGVVRATGVLPWLDDPARGAGVRELDQSAPLPLLSDRQIIRLMVRRWGRTLDRLIKAARGRGGADA